MKLSDFGKTWPVPRRNTDSDQDHQIRAAMYAWYLQSCLDAGREPDDSAFLVASDPHVQRIREAEATARAVGECVAASYDAQILAVFTA